MDKETTTQEQESSPVYIIGAIVIVAIIIAGVLLWPKPGTKQTANTTLIVEEKKTITALTCDKQWFNPKIGFSEYYLSAEGTAVNDTKSVECTFTITANADGKVVGTASASAVFTTVPERNGKTYICTTKAVALPKGSNVTMATLVKDDTAKTATCTAGTITLP